jgi:hypothetical protein
VLPAFGGMHFSGLNLNFVKQQNSDFITRKSPANRPDGCPSGWKASAFHCWRPEGLRYILKTVKNLAFGYHLNILVFINIGDEAEINMGEMFQSYDKT